MSSLTIITNDKREVLEDNFEDEEYIYSSSDSDSEDEEDDESSEDDDETLLNVQKRNEARVLTQTTYDSILRILNDVFPASIASKINSKLIEVGNIDISRRYLVDLISIINNVQKKSKEEVREAIDDALAGYFSTSSRFYKSFQKDYSKYCISEDDVKEGAVTCSRCGSRKTLSRSMQTRSADEGQTSFITCVRCKARWTMN